jgi:hypothetical protein
MALEKLKIKPQPPSKLEEISALFNPNAYSITKQVTWTPPRATSGQQADTQRIVNAPTLSFGGGGSRQLTLELFFDVTEPINGQAIDDVRKETDKIAALTRIERDLHQPPTCEVFWGTAPTTSDFPFVGVVNNLTQRFTLFRSDGKPIRANLTVVFVEFLDPTKDQRETDPELTSRIVKRGDTLSLIAAEVYRDPNLWRMIAIANGLDDPRRLEIGQPLTIPRIR